MAGRTALEVLAERIKGQHALLLVFAELEDARALSDGCSGSARILGDKLTELELAVTGFVELFKHELADHLLFRSAEGSR